MIKKNRIHLMDAVEGMRKLSDESVDLIVTDPPYNIASRNKKILRRCADGKRKAISTMEAWGEWDSRHPFDHDLLIRQIISEGFRVLKKGGTMYMFTAEEDNSHFLRAAESRGFRHRIQLIILKRDPPPSLYRNTWRRAYQVCMCLTKPGKARTFHFVSQQELVNVFPYSVNSQVTRHPTEKPLDFIRLLIRVSSNPGDLVLDPFMGSGTTAVAAKGLGRDFIGFDLSAEYIEMAKKRLREGAQDVE